MVVHPRVRWIFGTVGLVTCLAGLSLTMATVVDVRSAGAATEPPPVIIRAPHSAQLRVGHFHTFTAVAQDAGSALWLVSTDGGSTWSTYGTGDNSTRRNGDLKSSLSFGPFAASENGWELGVAFVNDPCGVPSCIQVTGSSPVTITQEGSAGG